MDTRRRLVRWASGIMLGLGAGHLLLLAVMAREAVADWAERGLWAAVPLADGGAASEESLENQLTFWAGPGSFAVPLVLLGLLTWHLAGRGVAVPAGIGWGLAVWCCVGGVLLVPSPYFVGAVSGVLIVLASRRGDEAGAGGGRGSDPA
ncbi:DUF6463 family protein [Streptomyces chengbuensis]|uniref:DUF6463 family protein n=1 Tax=Streptomyces TaxID=1883 RepID=UPI0025B41675|nr:DUF6463 family protein [Streptomyces sp. HUAS CB01]WJY48610.1 DUF6463 family protein [Streptomyces sp. HUAS CB01]